MQDPFFQQNTVSRGDFLKDGLQSFALAAVQAIEQTGFIPVNSPTTAFPEKPFLRPPGAQAEPLFLALCTRCDACTAACPHEAISVHYGAGPPYDGTPVLANLRDHPCLLCPDTPCIPACPTGALLPVESPTQIRIGTAILDRLNCTAYRGSGCHDCYTACPLPDLAIVLTENLPLIQSDACTGCGLCVQACPEDPPTIAVC